jgi:actin-related protein
LETIVLNIGSRSLKVPFSKKDKGTWVTMAVFSNSVKPHETHAGINQKRRCPSL